MAVALISAVDPYPTDAGKKVVLAGFVDYFVDRYGADDVHYIKVGRPPGGDFPVNIHVADGPGGKDVLRSVATKVTTGRASLQEAFLASRQTMVAIRRILDRIQPGLQIYDTVRMAQYAPDDVARGQVCYLDDLFSERYDRMLKAAARYPDVEISPLGNFSEHVAPRLRWLATNRLSQLALLRLERRLVLRSENRTAARFGRCLLVNDVEAAQLERRAGVAPGRIQSVPPLVNVVGATDRQYRGAPEFVFLGLLSLPHNDDGLKSFLRTSWPLVLAKMPEARLRVIGRDASSGLLELTAQLGDSVTVEGFIPDLGEALDRAAALVNPLRFGSGIKLKVFEALARGLPVVSTDVGAEGIASGPGTGILVADDPTETAELLCSLTSAERNAQVSEDARAHFASTYSRRSVFEVYDSAFTL